MKPAVGTPIPEMSFARLNGDPVKIGGARDRHLLLVVYRGKHCPKCKTYLNKLDAMADKWDAAGMDIVVVSADPLEKAQADQAEFGWGFPLCYDLSEAQMRALGLYVTDPLSPQETDRRFAEPGVFCITPDGTQQLVCISNGPAARPDLDALLDGMIFNITNNRPARGMA